MKTEKEIKQEIQICKNKRKDEIKNKSKFPADYNKHSGNIIYLTKTINALEWVLEEKW